MPGSLGVRAVRYAFELSTITLSADFVFAYFRIYAPNFPEFDRFRAKWGTQNELLVVPGEVLLVAVVTVQRHQGYKMAWKPPENKSDLDRINNLLQHYERVNLDQIQQIEHLNQTHDANAKRILDLEKTKKTLEKNVKSLEGRMKFDRIAADGIKKKFNLLEIEARELKHANEQFGIERSEDKERIVQLVDDLNNNRSDKLKFMHENANLKKQNAELVAYEKEASGDALVARKDILQKLEMVDHLLALNETYKRTIAAQSEEVLSLSHEQHDLNDRLMHAKKQVVTLESMTAEYNKTIDILQHEISRLRKELMSVANAVSVKSSAVLSRSGTKNRSNSISTTIINSSYSGEEDGPYSLTRRPYLHATVSRDRNKLNSTSINGGSSHYESGLLPSLADPSASGPGTGSLRHLGNKYQYVDLTEHLHQPHESQGTMVLVDGGAIGTGGQGLHTTVRSHILQGYEEALAPAPSPDKDKWSAALRHSLSSVSVASLSTATGKHSSAEYMCSPVSTPFRKTAANAQAPLQPLSLSQHAQSLKSGSADASNYKLTDSVSQLKKCYSAPVNAHTATGTGTSNSGHSRSLGVSKSYIQQQDQHDRPHSPLTVESEMYNSGSHSPPTTADNSIGPCRGPGSGVGGGNNNTVRFANHNQNQSGKLAHKQTAGSQYNSKTSVADASNKKSLFVGAGLGLKHNEALDAELRNLNKGSTHQLLKKILGDRFD